MTQPQSRPNLDPPSAARSRLELPPDLDAVAELLRIAGHSTRLKILYLLHHTPELTVTRLAEILEVTVQTASRHLIVLRNHRLIAPRADFAPHADRRYTHYHLTDHPFHQALRTSLFDAATDDRRGHLE